MSQPVKARRSIASKLRPYLGSLHILTRKKPVSFLHFEPREPTDKEKHCVILHGWAADGDSMRAIGAALRDLPQAADRHFWIAHYDTNWTPLNVSARQIMRELQSQPHDFSDTLLIGYSMGGLVARRMVIEGFPCRDLIAIATPHLGTCWWIPTIIFGPFLRGPHSMGARKRTISAINRHPKDKANRERYHFFAMTYRDACGPHRHDGIVTHRSALGEDLGPIATRKTMSLEYSYLATFDAHWRCMFPDYIPEVIEKAGELMAK